MASELKPCQIADALAKCDWAGSSIGNKAIVSLAIEALRNARAAPVATPADATDEMVEAALAVDWDNDDERATVHNIWHAMTAKLRPAPAATDTGLVTVKRELLEAVKFFDDFPPSIQRMSNIRVVEAAHKYIEQAEKLLAAKDKTIALAETTMIEMHQDLNKLEADNAAQAARIKELDGECNELVTKCNEIIDQRDHALNACAQMEEYKEALEAKLAAAEKALEFYADRENWKNGHFEQAEGGTVLRHHPSSVHKDRGATARAVLGEKPS
ncbi:hypothetical protein L3V16_08545 [Brucella ciceri]|uniref:hypothetical protein n=1 Tax=Brucella ciceri TaxID=391287 RepID=UPI001F12E590|nr:hypothetical protein [Brucella ciceri]MCH6203891.1 hypothetical protein [Brucella ciceri]